MNIFLNPNATEAAIQTAIRNADKAEAAGYWVSRGGVHSGVQCWNVFKPGNDATPAYIVCAHANFADCDCEQCQREGYCKHIELAARQEAWEESVVARADEWAATEEDRFFMAECQAEVMASVAGEWWG